MACGYQKWLRDYLDGTLPEKRAQQVQAHLESCPDCQAEQARWQRFAGALAAFFRAAPEPTRTPVCPDAVSLADYADNLLPGRKRRVLARHITHCPFCQAQVAELKRALATEPARGQRTSGGPGFGFLLRPGIALAFAAGIVLLIVFWPFRATPPEQEPFSPLQRAKPPAVDLSEPSLEEARQRWIEAQALDKHSRAEASFRLGRAYARQGQWAPARERYEEALALFEEEGLTEKAQQVREVLAELERRQ
jgi:tetratricopeptide (TPR) repeat protein